MKDLNDKSYKCKLCGKYFLENEMSDEHYPARSVGNEDIVAFDIVKAMDVIQSKEFRNEITNKLANNVAFEDVVGDICDEKLSKPLYRAGRTARTLCQNVIPF